MGRYSWDRLNHLQVGRFAEYYVQMEFALYGFEVYTTEVDDRGVTDQVKVKCSDQWSTSDLVCVS